jgi:hypothetical protein
MAVNIGAKKVAGRVAVAAKARSQRPRSSAVATPAVTIASRAQQGGQVANDPVLGPAVVGQHVAQQHHPAHQTVTVAPGRAPGGHVCWRDRFDRPVVVACRTPRLQPVLDRRGSPTRTRAVVARRLVQGADRPVLGCGSRSR